MTNCLYCISISYYSFDVGLAHFISLNVYDTHDDSQFLWLEQDLKNVDRSVTPWIFVFTHAPLYNANTAHLGEFSTARQKEAVEPMFIKYRVNVVFSGSF